IFGLHGKAVLGWNLNLCQQRFIPHPTIAVGVSGRDVALVAKKQKDAVPDEVGVVCGEQRIESFWSRATGERDRESSLGADGGASGANEFFGSGVKKIGGTGKHFNRSSRRHTIISRKDAACRVLATAQPRLYRNAMLRCSH